MLSGVPREHVVPYPFKILNSQGMIVIMYEALHSYRQIFMDGRKLPKDPNPDLDGLLSRAIGMATRWWSTPRASWIITGWTTAAIRERKR